MKKYKRKFHYYIFLLILPFLLSGCWSSRAIEDLNVVIGSSLDKDGDGNIISTLQYVIPEAMNSSSGGSSTPEKPYINIKGTSVSLEPSGWETTLKREGYIFGPHQKTVIISEELAREIQLRQITDLYFRDIDIRGSTLIFISKGRADKVLETKEPNVIPSIRIDQIAEQNLTTRMLSNTTLVRIGGLMNSGASFLLQLLDSINGEVEFNGAAVIQGKTNKMIGTFDKQDVEGINWLTGQGKGGAVKAFEQGDGPTFYQIEKMKSKIIPHVKGDKISFDVKIKSDGRIAEYWNPKLRPAFNQKNVKRIEKVGEKEVKILVENVINKMQKEYKVDVGGFSNQLRIKYPKVWNKKKKDWDNEFSKIPVKVHVNLNIKDYGMIGRNKNK